MIKEKINLNLLYLIMILIIAPGCSQGTLSPKLNEPIGVNLDFNSEQNEKSFPLIDNRLSNDDLPIPYSKAVESKEKHLKPQRMPVIALILGPGLNRVLAHLALLKSFEKNSITIHILSGSGMGSVLASLYSAGLTIEMIEWKFHKFLRKTKNILSFSHEWFFYVKEILLKDLVGKEIQNTKIKLVLPLISVNGLLELKSRGELSQTLLRGLTFFEKNYYNRKKILRSGADIVIGSDVLTGEIEFQNSKNSTISRYLSTVSYLKNNEKEFDYLFSLPMGEMPLDSQNNLPSSIANVSIVIKNEIKKIKNIIHSWTP